MLTNFIAALATVTTALATSGVVLTAPQLTAQASACSVNQGMASWYGPGFHGNTTANGELFDQWDYTAAHPYLPFGTQVAVTNLDNGQTVTVRINDRGPYTGDRIIDLSRASADAIGLTDSGIADVKLSINCD